MKKSVLLLVTLLAPLSYGQTKKIVVVGMPAEAVRDLQTASAETHVVPGQRGPALVEQVADADAIFGTITPELFHAAKRLKWVQIYSAGVESYRFPEFVNSDVVLTNCKIIQGPEIADHAFALLLALTRDVNRIVAHRTASLAAGKPVGWLRGQYQPIELRGKTAVVIGVGGIGSQIAQRAAAFGMRVIGVDPKEMPLNPYVNQMVFPDRLDSVLPAADVVFVSAPHTPRSEGMMGARQFALLKQGSYFIAVSRGKLYDTNALVKALDERRLAGAGLDVTNPEPLPEGHPLWKFDNVIISPHIAGQSDGIQARRMALLKENIARFARGETLENVVDKQKGY